MVLVMMCAGQLVVASLLSRNIKLRLVLRDPEKATSLFGEQDGEKLQVQCAFRLPLHYLKLPLLFDCFFNDSFNGR